MVKRVRPKKPIKQELDMAEHANRMRSLSGSPGDMMRGVLVWLAAGIILFALGWLAIGR
jgi:hypothetical protein